jgi:hypothetical protein
VLIFSLASVVFSKFCYFSLNKSYKTYLGPMLSPGVRNWQLIYPNCQSSIAAIIVGTLARRMTIRPEKPTEREGSVWLISLLRLLVLLKSKKIFSIFKATYLR